ncbi:MAG TPA: DUF3828 domain-containing protein [Croceibacterium sp.]
MTRRPAIAAICSLALAACSAPAEPEAAAEAQPAAAVAASAAQVDAAVQTFYQPYRVPFEQADTTADWDRPIFSAGLRAPIERWKRGFSDEEVAELQDFAWLCECQDWDPASFEVTIEPHPAPSDARAEVAVGVAIGWNETRAARLSLVREGNAWLIDDIRSEAFPDGLKAALEAVVARQGAGAA